MNPKVDRYLMEGCMRCKFGGTPQCKVNNWQEELKLLRSIVLDTGLTEELKWGMPCYTFQDKNVLMVSAFKEYASVNFFKGALLKDEAGILTSPGENSQATRQVRFTSVDEIIEKVDILKTYFHDAMEIEKQGLKIDFKKATEYIIPEELKQMFDESPLLEAAFESLTPGRQKGYLIYFSQPKQSKTRTSRIEKYIPQIMEGKGLNDDFRR